MGHKHDSLTDQRGALVTALIDAHRPGQAKIANIVAVDCFERAIALTIQCASPRRPIGSGRLRQRGVVNRGKAFYLAVVKARFSLVELVDGTGV